MTRGRAAAIAALPLLAGPLVLGACSTEIEPSATTLPPGSVTTTTVFVALGTTAELLDQLLSELAGLSERIVENDGDEALLERIELIWDAARPGVEVAAPGLVGEFDRAMEMVEFSVARRRHADADKALNNLRNLVAALSSTG